MSEELKKCPFCKGTPRFSELEFKTVEEFTGVGPITYEKIRFSVECDCGASMSRDVFIKEPEQRKENTKLAVIRNWNMRGGKIS